MADGEKNYGFPKSHRLRNGAEFRAVYDTAVKKNQGPITVFAKPNALAHPRLGLSVPKRVGSSPRRNRIKRLLRESFRLCQHDWPTGYDIVVVVRPHEPATLAEYQRMLFAAIRGLHTEWERRARRSGEKN